MRRGWSSSNQILEIHGLGQLVTVIMQLRLCLSQNYYLFIPRLAEKLIWGCFVNSWGGLGRNIPADLQIEHLNRVPLSLNILTDSETSWFNYVAVII